MATLDQLNEIQSKASDLEYKAKHLTSRKKSIAAARKCGLQILNAEIRYDKGSSEEVQKELDRFRYIILRATEMRLEAKAARLRSEARMVRQQLEYLIGDLDVQQDEEKEDG